MNNINLSTRRALLAATVPALTMTMTAASTSHASGSGATMAGTATILTVGPSRMFTTVHEAVAAATDASTSKRYLILIDPGTYDFGEVGGALTLNPYISIAGVDRQSTVLITRGVRNIRPASNTTIRSLSIIHHSSGSSGAIRCNHSSLTDLLLDDLHIEVLGNSSAVEGIKTIGRCEFRNSTIVTESTGLLIRQGGFIYMHDVNIHLIGGASEHIGISADRYCRIYIFGGKIGTGYGYPAVSSTSQNVIGMLTQPSFSGRIVAHGVWSICRNDGAPSGIIIACVRLLGPEGWVRLFGGYFQAENPTGAGGRETLSNPGAGKIEIYGTRCRTYGEGAIYSTNQIGRRIYTHSDDGYKMVGDMGGLAILDASNGPFTLILPSLPSETTQLIFKKVDATSNAITIAAPWRRIDGQPFVTLQESYALLHIRFVYGQYLIVG